MDEFARIASYLNIAVEVMLLGRLAQLRLLGTYPYFILYVALTAGSDMALTLIDPRSRTYLLLWAMRIPVIVSLLLAAALELYRLMIRRFIGLGKWGSLVLIAAASIGMGIAAVIGLLDTNALLLNVISGLVFFKQWALSAIAVLLLMSSWFFFRFDYMMPRNVVVHSRILTAYCLINAASALSLSLHIKRDVVDAVSLSGAAACFCLWTVLLSRKGEESPAPPVTPEEVDRVRRMQERIGGALGLPRSDRDGSGGAGVE